MTLTEYEKDILREIADPGSVEGLIWGAAMSVALEALQGGGFVTRGMRPVVTDKGRQFLENNNE